MTGAMAIMNRTGMALLACLLAAAGCSGSGPALARVSGTVSFEGKALAGATVCFVPDGSKGSLGRMAMGSTGADGRFSLQSFRPGDGAVIGFHRVSIAAMEHEQEAALPSADEIPKPPPPLKSRIPSRYNDPITSGLTAEVKAGVANRFDFKLTSGQ